MGECAFLSSVHRPWCLHLFLAQYYVKFSIGMRPGMVHLASIQCNVALVMIGISWILVTLSSRCANIYQRVCVTWSIWFPSLAFMSQLVKRASTERVDIKCHMGKYFQIAAYSIQMLFQPVCQNHRSFSLLERLASEYRWKESVQITLVASSPDLPHGICHSTLHFQLLSHGNSTGSQIGLLSTLHWNSWINDIYSV